MYKVDSLPLHTWDANNRCMLKLQSKDDYLVESMFKVPFKQT